MSHLADYGLAESEVQQGGNIPAAVMNECDAAIAALPPKKKYHRKAAHIEGDAEVPKEEPAEKKEKTKKSKKDKKHKKHKDKKEKQEKMRVGSCLSDGAWEHLDEHWFFLYDE